MKARCIEGNVKCIPSPDDGRSSVLLSILPMKASNSETKPSGNGGKSGNDGNKGSEAGCCGWEARLGIGLGTGNKGGGGDSAPSVKEGKEGLLGKEKTQVQKCRKVEPRSKNESRARYACRGHSSEAGCKFIENCIKSSP